MWILAFPPSFHKNNGAHIQDIEFPNFNHWLHSRKVVLDPKLTTSVKFEAWREILVNKNEIVDNNSRNQNNLRILKKSAFL